MWTDLNTSGCRGSCWQLGNNEPQMWQAPEGPKAPWYMAQGWSQHILPVPASPRSCPPAGPSPGCPAQRLLPAPNIISRISVSLSNGLCQPMVPSPWPSNPSAPGLSRSLPPISVVPVFGGTLILVPGDRDGLHRKTNWGLPSVGEHWFFKFHWAFTGPVPCTVAAAGAHTSFTCSIQLQYCIYTRIFPA